MGQAMPPTGQRSYEADRAAVLEAVREHGPCTVEHLRTHLGRRAGIMAVWHLLILGDHGSVEWDGDLVRAVPE